MDELDKTLAWLRKKEKAQITKIRNESGDIAAYPTEIKRIESTVSNLFQQTA